ncbi:MAG: glycosyltransferase [Butyrivibrio sp.]|nr:glycosyltransferase [Butyrivibrio sp.]
MVRSEKCPVTISVCMIVRDEEPVLERCLANVKQFADELIVVDTGSKDATREVACHFTDRLYDFEWIDDFAAARNYSYEKATCDYIMWLDADDDMEAEDIEKIQKLKKNMPSDTDVVMFSYTSDTDPRDPFMDSTLVRDRLIRRSLNPRWEYPIHEVIKLRPQWNILIRPDIHIIHRKIVVNEEGRNLRIMEKALSNGMPIDSYIRGYYCRELTDAKRYEEAEKEFDSLWETGDESDIDYALFFYIQSMNHLKRFDSLKMRLEDYIERFGKSEMVFCCLGDIYRREKNYEKAIEYYQKALEVDVDITDHRLHFKAYNEFMPLLGLGKCYYNLEQFEQADKYFEKAKMICPDNIELKLINLFANIGRRCLITEEC